MLLEQKDINVMKKSDQQAVISAVVLALILSSIMWITLGLPFFGIEYAKMIENMSYITVVGGVCGGLAMTIYSKPENIIDSFVRVVVCVMTANMLTQLFGGFLTKNQSTGEMWGVAFMIGFIAFPLLQSVAKFFENRRASDITEIVKDIKETAGK